MKNLDCQSFTPSPTPQNLRNNPQSPLNSQSSQPISSRQFIYYPAPRVISLPLRGQIPVTVQTNRNPFNCTHTLNIIPVGFHPPPLIWNRPIIPPLFTPPFLNPCLPPPFASGSLIEIMNRPL